MRFRHRKNKEFTGAALPPRFLIIRLSSIGDIVLTTPVVRCLRKKYPDARIDFIVKPQFRQVLEGNPYISNIIIYDAAGGNMVRALRNAQYSHIIDLHHNMRTLKLKQALGVKTFSFPKLNMEKWLLVNLKWRSIMPDKSIVERYFETVRTLGVVNDGEGLDYFIPSAQETVQEDIPMSHWTGYVACVLGGSKATKQLPTVQWIAFAERCQLPLIMLGGPEDREEGEAIARAIPSQRVYNACGKFKLNESADLVKKARVVVSNDTGLMHIAAAFRRPVVSLWGNTVPELGMFPYYGANNLKTMVASRSAIMEVNGLPCRPCSKIGYARCPKKHFKCMNDIDMQIVSEAVYRYWAGDGTPGR